MPQTIPAALKDLSTQHLYACIVFCAKLYNQAITDDGFDAWVERLTQHGEVDEDMLHAAAIACFDKPSSDDINKLARNCFNFLNNACNLHSIGRDTFWQRTYGTSGKQMDLIEHITIHDVLGLSPGSTTASPKRLMQAQELPARLNLPTASRAIGSLLLLMLAADKVGQSAIKNDAPASKVHEELTLINTARQSIIATWQQESLSAKLASMPISQQQAGRYDLSNLPECLSQEALSNAGGQVTPITRLHTPALAPHVNISELIGVKHGEENTSQREVFTE